MLLAELLRVLHVVHLLRKVAAQLAKAACACQRNVA
jgi:hypothetical protein